MKVKCGAAPQVGDHIRFASSDSTVNPVWQNSLWRVEAVRTSSDSEGDHYGYDGDMLSIVRIEGGEGVGSDRFNDFYYNRKSEIRIREWWVEKEVPDDEARMVQEAGGSLDASPVRADSVPDLPEPGDQGWELEDVGEDEGF